MVDITEAPPRADDIVAEIHAGLLARPRRLPTRLFYDQRGSQLFEAICATPDYYPTRTERSIYDRHLDEIAAACGAGRLVVEFGCGSGTKTSDFLAALEQPRGLVVNDISRQFLIDAAHRLEADLALPVQAVVGDFRQVAEFPVRGQGPRTGFFPGSTLGNFTRREAIDFLTAARDLLGDDGDFVLGVDLVKDQRILEAAYDDEAGITAAFNRNLLVHLATAFEAEVDPEAFAHRAPWVSEHQRIEMHLVARWETHLAIAGHRHVIPAGEAILTEYSHKFTRASIAHMAAASGWRFDAGWTDERGWFLVCRLVAT